MNKAIKIKDLSVELNNKLIFSKLNLEIIRESFTVILGRSGCGKTTLLKTFAGLYPHNSIIHGSIHSPYQPLKDHIAYMAQTDSLLPWLTTLENTLLAHRLKKQNNTTCMIQKANSLLHDLGLQNKINSYPEQLSGGMRQRVALARTLMQNKPIILMDEPFSSLDAITRTEMQALTAKLLADKTVIMVSHDPAEAIQLASDIYILHGNDKPASYFNHTRQDQNKNLHQNLINALLAKDAA